MTNSNTSKNILNVRNSMSANTLKAGQTRVTLKASDAAVHTAEKNAATKEAVLFAISLTAVFSFAVVYFL